MYGSVSSVGPRYYHEHCNLPGRGAFKRQWLTFTRKHSGYEAYELLGELEYSLLELEEKPDDAELIGRVFRAMHTIKGSGAMFGFEDIASFTHQIETVYDLIRNGELDVTSELIDLTLSAKDVIREMLNITGSDSVSNIRKREKIVLLFNKFLPEAQEIETDIPAKVQTEDGTKDVKSPKVTYRIRFKPPQDIFMRGIDPVNLIVELGALGDCKVIAQTGDIPLLEECNRRILLHLLGHLAYDRQGH